jgi:hypothetical protein
VVGLFMAVLAQAGVVVAGAMVAGCPPRSGAAVQAPAANTSKATTRWMDRRRMTGDPTWPYGDLPNWLLGRHLILTRGRRAQQQLPGRGHVLLGGRRYAPVVNRRGLSWLLSVSLAAVGSLAAHTLGLLPHAAEGREHLEARTEAAPHLPLLAGLLAALLITGLTHRAWRMVRRQPVRLLPPGWFVVVPPLGWALQEAAERRLGVESFPFDAAREPAFVKGLVVQLLFGVLAVLAARLLLAVAAQLRRRGQASDQARRDRNHGGAGAGGAAPPAGPGPGRLRTRAT